MMAPPRRISSEQLEQLISYLEQNREMSKGLVPGSVLSYQETRHKWSLLTKRLNALEGGISKSADGWRKYWVEWRHKCRKKAKRKQANSALKLNFSDLELRSLDISGDNSMANFIPHMKMDIEHDDDSDSIPLGSVKSHTSPIPVRKRMSTTKMTVTEDESSSLPPKWALEIEERRIVAQERMAEALESIASIMKSQEERRAFAEERLTETLTEISGTVNDLNAQVQVVVEQLQQRNSMQTNEDELKTVLFE